MSFKDPRKDAMDYLEEKKILKLFDTLGAKIALLKVCVFDSRSSESDPPSIIQAKINILRTTATRSKWILTPGTS